VPEGNEQPNTIYLVAREGSPEGPIIACIKGIIKVESDGTLVCEDGPIAVSPAYQGSGLGTYII
jgi:predicted N-acetyltransferase YhbS